jgi:hypothetical protein
VSAQRAFTPTAHPGIRVPPPVTFLQDVDVEGEPGSIISLAVFARTRNFAFLRTAQFLLILVAPALGMIMLGGLEDSSFCDPVVASCAARRGRLKHTTSNCGSKRSAPET